MSEKQSSETKKPSTCLLNELVSPNRSFFVIAKIHCACRKRNIDLSNTLTRKLVKDLFTKEKLLYTSYRGQTFARYFFGAKIKTHLHMNCIQNCWVVFLTTCKDLLRDLATCDSDVACCWPCLRETWRTLVCDCTDSPFTWIAGLSRRDIECNTVGNLRHRCV